MSLRVQLVSERASASETGRAAPQITEPPEVAGKEIVEWVTESENNGDDEANSDDKVNVNSDEANGDDMRVCAHVAASAGADFLFLDDDDDGHGSEHAGKQARYVSSRCEGRVLATIELTAHTATNDACSAQPPRTKYLRHAGLHICPNVAVPLFRLEYRYSPVSLGSQVRRRSYTGFADFQCSKA